MDFFRNKGFRSDSSILLLFFEDYRVGKNGRCWGGAKFEQRTSKGEPVETGTIRWNKKKKKRENKKGTKINYFGDHSTQAASSKGILRAYGICLRDCPCVSSLFREPVTDLCIFREWMARKRRFERGIN